MDIIYEAAAKYVSLQTYEYRFVLSQNRRIKVIRLNFMDEEFFHLTGMQYLTDIDVPRNKKKFLDNILIKRKINDTLLNKSRNYTNPSPDRDVRERISELRFLEEYIDNKNTIRIFTMRNQVISSMINADYVIESKLHNCKSTVYIFLKQRDDNSEYSCVVSFIKKNNITYGGDLLYWMLKEKKSLIDGQTIVIEKHKNYNPD